MPHMSGAPRPNVDFYVVDRLPHGQAVAMRIGGCEVDVYISREHSLDRVIADLNAVRKHADVVFDFRFVERPAPAVAS